MEEKFLVAISDDISIEDSKEFISLVCNTEETIQIMNICKNNNLVFIADFNIENRTSKEE